MTWRDFTNSFLVYDKEKSVEDKLQDYLSVDDAIMQKIALAWVV